MDGVVLVLNQNYEPLHVCDLRRAFRLVFGEKAEVIQYDHTEDPPPLGRSTGRRSVIRLQYHIRRPRPRGSVLPPAARCSPATDTAASTVAGPAADLTLDHVVPRHRGGAAHLAQPRGRVQGVQPPQGRATRFRTRRGCDPSAPPYEPRCDVYTLFTPYLADPRNEAWRDYLFLPAPPAANGVAPGPLTSGRLTAPPSDEPPFTADPRALAVLRRLWDAGHAAYLVGGAVRDALLGRVHCTIGMSPTTRSPKRILELFPGGVLREPVRDGPLRG